MARDKKPKLSRDVALAARPIKVPPKTAERKGNELHVTVEYSRPGWQRWLGAPSRCSRTFVLDEIGGEVYDACDRKHTVKQIVNRLAGKYQISVAEAEQSVATYLKTLMSKGLVAMEVDK